MPPRRCRPSSRPSATRAGGGTAAGGGTLASRLWSQQCEGQDDFFGRYSAVQKGAPVPALILTQLGRIHEEAITGGEQRVGSIALLRKLDRFLAGKEQRLLRTLGAQVFTELVPQVERGVPLGEHGSGRVAVDRAVIGREEHGDFAPRRLLQKAEQRRPLEPLPRDLPKGDLVARDLVQDLRFAASVGEQIHEVEH